ncbi:type 2 lanthipeptide synthetase LanM [Staphylococcus aureus]|uniref:type 2 lanthipeptide synthetase LanM n=1 Tax=Staphylococcus aureus TaxID=1280 RepID=UPI0021CE814E|nr:type 2 lanthipeptide synthetase LanM [Staphylococcus aureus]UXT88217.1 type 2 lanthipeptide synthetase LanM [Staphylococcus aureus]HEE9175388.1 type 2 lantipeptide synthetase LanM [Staphylococcus aureus]
MYKTILQERIKNSEEYFSEFYYPLLLTVENDIMRILSKNSNFIHYDQELLANIVDALIDEIHSISFKAILYEFYIYKMENETKIKKDYYINFKNKSMDGKFIYCFYKKYSYLNEVINKRLTFKIKYIEKILSDFRKDLHSIQKSIDPSIRKIKNIKYNYGDSHNLGKTVSFVETNSVKIIYKPRNLDTDNLFNDIAKIIEKNCKLNLPKICNVNLRDHGWQEEIKYKECENEKDAERYFYRIGMNLSLFHFFHTDDMHHENLIAHGEYPYFLDLETLISFKKMDDIKESNILGKYLEKIHNSVLNISLLPNKLKNALLDVDLGALSIKQEESSTWQSYVIKDVGKDNMRIEKQNSPIIKDNSIVKIKNKKIHPINYIDNILNGFSDGYESIIKNKNEILKLLNSQYLQNIKFRYIHRATNQYVQFLIASTHPNYISTKEKTINLFNKFKKHSNNLNISSNEVKSLLNLDVPYFLISYNSKSLFDFKNDIIVNNYFSITPKEFLEKRFEFMNKDDKLDQLHFIKLSMVTDNPDDVPYTSFYKQQILGFNSSEPDYILKDIKDELIRHAILNKEKATWFVHEIQGNNNIFISPLGYGLYDSSGTLILLFELSKYFNDKNARNFAIKGVKALEEQEVFLDQQSVFTGIGSYIYLYSYMYIQTKENKYLKKAKRLTKQINLSKLDDKDIKIDFIDGLSGLITLLVNCYKSLGVDIFLVKALELLPIMLNKYNSMQGYLTGLAHGYSGIALAISAIYSVTQNSEMYEKCIAIIKKENEYYDERLKNWKDLRKDCENINNHYWCHGSAGIALSRLQILKNIGYNKFVEKDLQIATKATLNHGLQINRSHSLCHGSLGNLLILQEINNYYKNDEIQNTILNSYKESLESIKKYGYNSGITSETPVNNFMLGKYGLVYSILKYKKPSISNNILTLTL